MHKSIRRAAAWRLCTELIRRHPNFLATEEHASGGLYDELVVREPESTAWTLRCNIEGTIHVFRGDDHANPNWEDYLTSDPRAS